MRANIECKTGNPVDFKMTDRHGNDLPAVESVDIRIRPGELISAIVAFSDVGISMKGVDIYVTPEHLKEVADKMGYDLVKKA